MGCQKVKHRLGPIKAGLTCLLSLSLADAIHPEGTPWILPGLDPGSRGDWQGERGNADQRCGKVAHK